MRPTTPDFFVSAEAQIPSLVLVKQAFFPFEKAPQPLAPYFLLTGMWWGTDLWLVS